MRGALALVALGLWCPPARAAPSLAGDAVQGAVDERQAVKAVRQVSDPCAVGVSGVSALDAAVRRDFPRVIRRLASEQCSLDARVGEGRTALELAAELAPPATVELLIKLGADPDGRSRSPLDLGPVPFATRGAALPGAPAALGDVWDGFVDGATPLMTAARLGRLDVVEVLLAGGADAGLRSDEGWTAHLFALGRDDVSERLGPLPASTDATVLLLAGDAQRVDLLLAHRADSLSGLEPPALHTAVWSDQPAVIASLLGAGHQVDVLYEDPAFGQGKGSALHLAAQVGHARALAALLEGGGRRYREMEGVPDPTETGQLSLPMSLAARGGHRQALVALHEDGDDVDAETLIADAVLAPDPLRSADTMAWLLPRARSLRAGLDRAQEDGIEGLATKVALAASIALVETQGDPDGTTSMRSRALVAYHQALLAADLDEPDSHPTPAARFGRWRAGTAVVSALLALDAQGLDEREGAQVDLAWQRQAHHTAELWPELMEQVRTGAGQDQASQPAQTQAELEVLRDTAMAALPHLDGELAVEGEAGLEAAVALTRALGLLSEAAELTRGRRALVRPASDAAAELWREEAGLWAEAGDATRMEAALEGWRGTGVDRLAWLRHRLWLCEKHLLDNTWTVRAARDLAAALPAEEARAARLGRSERPSGFWSVEGTWDDLAKTFEKAGAEQLAEGARRQAARVAQRAVAAERALPPPKPIGVGAIAPSSRSSRRGEGAGGAEWRAQGQPVDAALEVSLLDSRQANNLPPYTLSALAIALHDAGFEHAAAGRLSRAQASLALAAAFDPAAETEDLLGLVTRELGSPEEGAEHHRRALSLLGEETSPALHFRFTLHLGLAQAELGLAEAGVETLTGLLVEAQAASPADRHALYSNLWYASTQQAEARQRLDLLAQVAPDVEDRDLRYLYAAEQVRSAIELGELTDAASLPSRGPPAPGATAASFRPSRSNRRADPGEQPSVLQRAQALNNIGLSVAALGRPDDGATALNQAVVLLENELGPLHPETLNARHSLGEILVRDPDSDAVGVESHVLSLLADASASERPLDRVHALLLAAEWLGQAGERDAAVTLAKLAVRQLERLRSQQTELGGRGLIRFHADAYRLLADLLFRAERLVEAEAVVDLLKLAELSGPTRGNDQPIALELSAKEQELEQRLTELQDGAEVVHRRISTLRRMPARPAAAEAELGRLVTRRMDLMLTFGGYLAVLKKAAEQGALGADAAGRLEELRSELHGLRDVLGPNAAVLVVLPAADRTHLLLVSAGPPARFESDVGREQLNSMAARAGLVLRQPTQDPRAALAAVYDAVLAPVRPRLDAAGIDTVVLLLDGKLRYLPFAALWDGTSWAGDHFAFAVLPNLRNTDRLENAPSGPRSVAAFGVSGAHTVGGHDLGALAAVKVELDAIVLEAGGDTNGVVPGTALLDEAFGRDALLGALGYQVIQRPPVVHFATHFVLDPERSEGSFLLTGDGTLPLDDLWADDDLQLRGVDLLTLSACQTAVGGRNALGVEFDALATQALNKRAGAVLASLWKVNDDSTATWMVAMYQAWAGGASKAQAVQAAQRGMAASDAAASNVPRAGRLGGDADWTQARLAHPYFWAPFVLVGNWR